MSFSKDIERKEAPDAVYLWNFDLARVQGGFEEKLRFAYGLYEAEIFFQGTGEARIPS